MCFTCITAQDSEYVLTFEATGCPNKIPNLDWWKAQADNTVFADMFNYCNLVKDGQATVVQKRQCCGEGNECKPSSCIRQHHWTTGIETIIAIITILR